MTEMTKREQIARALFGRALERDVVDGTWEENEAIQCEFLADARAALSAMETPTEEMIEAIAEKLEDTIWDLPGCAELRCKFRMEPNWRREIATSIFKAGIAAALKE